MLRYKTRPRTCGGGLAARPNRILREFTPRNRRTRLAFRFLRRLARIPVRGDVAVTSNTVRRVRAEPDDGRCHHARGNKILAIEPRFLWHHRRVGWTPWHHDVHGHARPLEFLRVARGHGLEAGLCRAVGLEPAAQHREEAGRDGDD